MKINIIEASDLNYDDYSLFQREAYRDLLLDRGVSDAFMNPVFYRWKYLTPFGAGKVAQVMEGEKVVSSSAMIPFRIWDGKECLTGWQCLDVATLPEARRKGYFIATLKELMGCIAPDDIFYAFPNEKSIPSFLKLQCCENVLLTTWVNFFALIVKRKCHNITEISNFDPSCDLLIKKLADRGPMLDRSSVFLNWRYSHHPVHKYHCFVYMRDGACLGLAVVRKAHVLNRDIILVMEIRAVDEAVSIRLLQHIAAWTVNEKKNIIVMMNSAFLFRLGMKVGFLPVPAFLLPKKQILVLHTSGLRYKHLLEKKWDIQTGDWDVF